MSKIRRSLAHSDSFNFLYPKSWYSMSINIPKLSQKYPKIPKISQNPLLDLHCASISLRRMPFDPRAPKSDSGWLGGWVKKSTGGKALEKYHLGIHTNTCVYIYIHYHFLFIIIIIITIIVIYDQYYIINKKQ